MSRRVVVRVLVLLVFAVVVFDMAFFWTQTLRRRRDHESMHGRDMAGHLAAEVGSDDADNAQQRQPHLSHLIVVAGHAVYLGPLRANALLNESNWALEAHQHGQVRTFIKHIKLGASLAAGDEKALLLFSGGKTRLLAGTRSEAESYETIGDILSWWNLTDQAPTLKMRINRESYARDSFENVLFSICRFYELTGNYPSEMTVVSFPFKEYRFSHLHRAAIGIPAARFHYVSEDPSKGISHEDSPEGEVAVRKLFEGDPYGCKPPLSTKRRARDPFSSQHNYLTTCPEMRDLLQWCGNELFAGPLPWSIAP